MVDSSVDITKKTGNATIRSRTFNMQNNTSTINQSSFKVRKDDKESTDKVLTPPGRPHDTTLTSIDRAKEKVCSPA